jgi:hypothetical protein
MTMYENGVLRKIFGPKRDEVTGEWRKVSRNSVICSRYQILLSWLYEVKWDGWGMEDIIKEKVNLSLFLTKYHTMKTYLLPN